MTYEELLIEYNDLTIIESDLSKVDGLKGLYINGCIAIERKLSNTDKSCILAEEIGHHLTTALLITESKNIKLE